MLLAASVHGAERLRDAGFLLRVLPDAELQAEALAHAHRIAALAPAAARLNKATFAALRQAGAQAAVAPLLASAYDYADSAEHREGIAAFLAKRPPVF
jgi:enoyl-CoA hydratase/carnithine racemase